MSELWTAIEKTDDMIIFEVVNEQTQTTRQEQRYKTALPLIFSIGGYPATIAAVMLTLPLPWQFRKSGDQIYIIEDK